MRAVGASGLKLSGIGLGTLTWGRDTDEFEAHDQFGTLLEAGGNWIETSDSYGDGLAEELVGQVIKTAPREDFCIVVNSGRRTQGGYDLSRRHLRQRLDASLSRLELEYVDLWQLGGPDAATPLPEIAQTLDLALGSGLTSYVGLCNFPAWQVAIIKERMQRSDLLVAGSYEHSLVAREVEADVLPALAALDMGLLAWSPLGRGVLSGKYRRHVPADSRAASPHLGEFAKQRLGEHSRSVVEAVAAAAEGLGVTPLEVALAWARDFPGTTAILSGARNLGQLRLVLASADLQLPSELRAALDDVSAVPADYPTSGWRS